MFLSPAHKTTPFGLAYLTTAREGIVNIPPLLHISVPQTLSPLTSLPKISTKDKADRALLPPTQEASHGGGGGEDRMGQRTSKTETTTHHGANPPGPSGFCLHWCPCSRQTLLSRVILPRFFGSRNPSSLFILEAGRKLTFALSSRRKWVSVPTADTSHPWRPCLLQVT